MTALLDLFSALSATAGDATFWMPERASTFADEVDGPFYVVYWISVFFTLLISALLIYFVVKYRRRGETSPDTADAPTHHTLLEVTWTALPLMLVIVLFYVGFEGYMNMELPPQNAMQVDVTAQRWSWTFTYPENGWQDAELHVPGDRPVQLLMRSTDVLHSFFVPDFRVKKDVVPGKFSRIWFESPNDTGEPTEHWLLCAEYCGKDHSRMIARVVVHPTYESYAAWLEDAADIFNKYPPHVAGSILFEKRGCVQCHTTDGAPLTGPSLKGAWSRAANRDTEFEAFGRIDLENYDGLVENYLREAILYSQAKIVAGYPENMPTFKGQLDEQEVAALIAYIKWLDEEGHVGSALEAWRGENPEAAAAVEGGAN